MSHGSTDARYMGSNQNSPAYTWTPEPMEISYRQPQMLPLMSYKHWNIGSPPQEDATIVHSPHMTYETSPLTFVSDITPEVPVGDQASTAITLDEHCHATSENLPPRGTHKAVRRASRRPNPVLVPNLTKKARGRPVPTKDTLLKGGSGRAYACPVDECRKVFTRAEHLKRHTRSIHTNEKPFMCAEANCGRLFTRHDNLLQHIKNHRNSPPTRDFSLEYGPLDRVHIQRSSTESSSECSQESSSMGVLIPPSISAMPMSFAAESMQRYEVDAYRGDMSPETGGAPSPDSSPGPGEPTYMTYTYGYPWPQSDIRSMPSTSYSIAAEPRYAHSAREQLLTSAGAYGYHS